MGREPYVQQRTTRYSKIDTNEITPWPQAHQSRPPRHVDKRAQTFPRSLRPRSPPTTTVHARTLGHRTLHDDNTPKDVPHQSPPSPIIQSADDAKAARALLETPLSTLKEEDRLGQEERERRGRATPTLTRSSHQLALVNNEMLENALKRTGKNGKNVDWRRWSEREDPPTIQFAEGPSSESLYVVIRSSSASPSNTSPTTSTNPTHDASADPPTTIQSTLPQPLPTPSQKEKELTAELEKLRTNVEELAAAKEQLEGKLESKSQALFEEANKKVSDANRKAAETEEELRIVADQRDTLKGAMRIVGSPPVFLYSRRMVHELFEGRSSNYSDRTTFLPYVRLWIWKYVSAPRLKTSWDDDGGRIS
ncbi:hypothetical protein M422DRAFT_261782 [Sphaerobolus stellatus SS14]|uniref:Unplaced genomic scaffold SPHSTscaffold_109, whole genome shotgun sequence n=1 Tax=Sphaerobolus stellatus (strain SS14) TaxID=990650 RepID=A0A0C9VE41_SPHS4|nr:hypothetical protein M422DRAFT_261782 [Sphaerobolus stellatus SS14]